MANRMNICDDQPSFATVLRMFFNVLSAGTAFAWLKFADVRDGHLDSPNIHHRVCLRVLITVSTLAVVTYLVSLLVTVAPIR